MEPFQESGSLTLIDRDAQFNALKAALENCAAGNAQVLVAEGGAGCGKSEFLGAALQSAAASSVLVLRAAGLRTESGHQLGVLRQLVNNQALPDALRLHLLDVLDDVRSSVRPHQTDPAAPAAEPVRMLSMQRVCAVFQRLADISPVVIGIDDLQYADPESLHYLLHTTRHSRTTRILLLCTALPCSQAVDPVLDTELLRQQNFRRITLDCLSQHGVTRLLSAHPTESVAALLVGDFLAATGGNPLLLRALLEDHMETVVSAAAGPDESAAQPPGPLERPSHTAVGGRFYRAVQACLYSTGTATRQTAGAVAVLGRAGNIELLGRLLGVSVASAAQGLYVLDMTGLTMSGRFRHPVAAAAALDTLDLNHRVRLHRHAAALLHHDGAPPRDVARHLLAARYAAGPWAVSVLRDAAEQALAEDDVKSAISYLELAHGARAGERQRTEIRIRLAVATWRTNTWVAEKYLAELLTELRAGKLTASQTALLARLLIGHGRLDEAGEVLDRLHDSDNRRDSRAEVGFHMAGLWASVVHMPRHVPGQASLPPLDAFSAARVSAEEMPGLRMAAAVWTLPGDGTSESAARVAEQVLQTFPLTDTTAVLVTNAIRTLACTGRCGAAEIWCNRLFCEATRRRSPGWQAQFLSLHAEISLRRGMLADAEEYARRAMVCVPGRSGGVFIGGPLASQVLACTAMGRYDDATRQLNHPVPEALFHSVYGLNYLRARGQYYLAMNCFLAALSDFLKAGQLARRWGLDHPALLPWRTDAAEAFLRLGEPSKAVELIEEQLLSIHGGNPHVRGVSLRLRAQTAAPAERPRILTEAVNELQSCGDRLELARGLADLGALYQGQGESARASAMIRRAWQMANECGARALCDSIMPGHGSEGRPPRVSEGKAETGLSESEMRVAVLAAGGNTNREISAKLYITASTVEQHLTRAYRKLNITRRRQLPARLHT